MNILVMLRYIIRCKAFFWKKSLYITPLQAAIKLLNIYYFINFLHCNAMIFYLVSYFTSNTCVSLNQPHSSRTWAECRRLSDLLQSMHAIINQGPYGLRYFPGVIPLFFIIMTKKMQFFYFLSFIFVFIFKFLLFKKIISTRKYWYRKISWTGISWNFISLQSSRWS